MPDPFGGLETLMKYRGGGEFIKKIEPGKIVLFGGIVAKILGIPYAGESGSGTEH